MALLNEVMAAATEHGGVDLLFVADRPPLLVLPAAVIPGPGDVLSPEVISDIIRVLLAHRIGRGLASAGNGNSREQQFMADLPGLSRFRVSVFQQRQTPAFVLRPISQAVPRLSGLDLPENIAEFLLRRRGLILVAGPSAAGKSTTLAAMVDYINQRQRRHIISIENPMEYPHPRRVAVISQRSVPEDTISYARAVRAALRQAPDVLVVGDVMDQETAMAALGAAEAGMLVIAAVHSKDAADAVERLLSMHRTGVRRQVAVQIANTLLVLLVQQLLSRRNNAGRVVATELLIGTPAVRHVIRTDRSYRLNILMQSGRPAGMHTMEDSLVGFAQAGVIEYGEAITATVDPELFLNLYKKPAEPGPPAAKTRRLLKWLAPVPEGHSADGAYGLIAPPDATVYRMSFTEGAAGKTWLSNGLISTEAGALVFRPDPFMLGQYAQLTDYSIWLGERPPFRLNHYVRIIIQAGGPPGVTRSRLWLLTVFADGTAAILPDDDEPGIDLLLNNEWQTVHCPIPADLAGKSVRAYAVRVSQPEAVVTLREVFFT